MKTLIAKEKTKEQAFNQIKRWFKKNPNRKKILIQLKDGIISVDRLEIQVMREMRDLKRKSN